MEGCVHDIAFVIEVDGDLRVALDAGDRIDNDGRHGMLLSRNASWPGDRECGHREAR
jgi:hypothetical protein